MGLSFGCLILAPSPSSSFLFSSSRWFWLFHQRSESSAVVWTGFWHGGYALRLILEFLRLVQTPQLPRAAFMDEEVLQWPSRPSELPHLPPHPRCCCKRGAQHSCSIVDLLQTNYWDIVGPLHPSPGVGSPVRSSSSPRAQMQPVPSVLAQCCSLEGWFPVVGPVGPVPSPRAVRFFLKLTQLWHPGWGRGTWRCWGSRGDSALPQLTPSLSLSVPCSTAAAWHRSLC